MTIFFKCGFIPQLNWNDTQQIKENLIDPVFLLKDKNDMFSATLL